MVWATSMTIGWGRHKHDSSHTNTFSRELFFPGTIFTHQLFLDDCAKQVSCHTSQSKNQNGAICRETYKDVYGVREMTCKIYLRLCLVSYMFSSRTVVEKHTRTCTESGRWHAKKCLSASGLWEGTFHFSLKTLTDFRPEAFYWRLKARSTGHWW